MSLIHLNKQKNSETNIRNSEAKTDFSTKSSGLKTTFEKLCPICNQKAFVYTTCFDCKNPIQWICYKCSWESNLRVHDSCHKNVTIQDSHEQNNCSKYGFKEKLSDTYRTVLQKTALLSLYH